MATKQVSVRKEDQEVLDMIGKALEKKRERKIVDFFDGSQKGARSQIEKLFNRAQYARVELSDADNAFLAMISLILSLSPS